MKELGRDVGQGFPIRRNGSDLSSAYNEIANTHTETPNYWARLSASVSEQSNLGKLGFPTSFQFFDSNQRGPGVTADGAPLATPCSEERARATRTDRQFQVDEQGNSTYRWRQGDKLSDIVREMLSRNGQAPSQELIARTTAELGRINNINRDSVVNPGQEIRIPASLRNQTPAGEQSPDGQTQAGRTPRTERQNNGESARPGQRPEQRPNQRPGQRSEQAETQGEPGQTERNRQSRRGERRGGNEGRAHNGRERQAGGGRRQGRGASHGGERRAQSGRGRRAAAAADQTQADAMSPEAGAENPTQGDPQPNAEQVENQRVQQNRLAPPGNPARVESQPAPAPGAPANHPESSEREVATQAATTSNATTEILGRTTRFESPTNIRFETGQGRTFDVAGVSRIDSRYVPGRAGEAATYQSVVSTANGSLHLTQNERGQVIDARRVQRR